MSRRFIGCLFMLVLFAAAALAADPFLGTWELDMAKLRQEFKDLPPNAIAETFKVEAYRGGYKITKTVQSRFTTITTVDFTEGVSSVRKGKEKKLTESKLCARARQKLKRLLCNPV